MRWVTGMKWVTLALVVATAVGCSGVTRITSDPSKASVSLNERFIGTTPFSHEVKDRWGWYSVYIFTAEKEGYEPDTKIVREENFIDDPRSVIPPQIHFVLQPLGKSQPAK